MEVKLTKREREVIADLNNGGIIGSDNDYPDVIISGMPNKDDYELKGFMFWRMVRREILTQQTARPYDYILTHQYANEDYDSSTDRFMPKRKQAVWTAVQTESVDLDDVDFEVPTTTMGEDEWLKDDALMLAWIVMSRSDKRSSVYEKAAKFWNKYADVGQKGQRPKKTK